MNIALKADKTDWVALLREHLAQERAKGLVSLKVYFIEPTAEDLKNSDALAQARAKEVYKWLTMPKWQKWRGRFRGRLFLWQDSLRCRLKRFQNRSLMRQVAR